MKEIILKSGELFIKIGIVCGIIASIFFGYFTYLQYAGNSIILLLGGVIIILAKISGIIALAFLIFLLKDIRDMLKQQYVNKK